MKKLAGASMKLPVDPDNGGPGRRCRQEIAYGQLAPPMNPDPPFCAGLIV